MNLINRNRRAYTWGVHVGSSPKGCWDARYILPGRGKLNTWDFFTFSMWNGEIWRGLLPSTECKGSKHWTPGGRRTVDPTRWTWCSCSWRGGDADWFSARRTKHNAITWVVQRSKDVGRARRAGSIYGSSEEEFLLKCVTKELKKTKAKRIRTLLFHSSILGHWHMTWNAVVLPLKPARLVQLCVYYLLFTTDFDCYMCIQLWWCL